MDKLIMGNLHIPNKQIFQEWKDLIFREGSSELRTVLEITTFAELGDDVTVVNSWVDIKAADDIKMCQFFYGLDFKG